MYNRGTKPLDATISKTDSSPDPDQRDLVLKGDLLWLGMVTVVAEVLVRLKLDKGMILGSGIEGTSGLDGGMGVIWVIASVLAELLAQYSITLCLALGVLYLRGWWIPEYGRRDRGGAQKETDGRRSNFRYVAEVSTKTYIDSYVQTNTHPPYSLIHLYLTSSTESPPVNLVSVHLDQVNNSKRNALRPFLSR